MCEIFELNLVLKQLKKQINSIVECAIFTYHENPIWQRPPYWISKNAYLRIG